jgi:hypothetical protein
LESRWVKLVERATADATIKNKRIKAVSHVNLNFLNIIQHSNFTLNVRDILRMSINETGWAVERREKPVEIHGT